MLAGFHVLFVILSGLASLAGASPSAADLEFFEREVRPVLAEHCFTCHGPERQRAALRLDHIEFIRKGGETGAVLSPGAPEDSALIRAIRYADVDLQMPPSGQLPKRAQEALERWVSMGAPWPSEALPGGSAEESPFDLWARKDRHWAWQPIASVTSPEVAHPAWNRSDIDRFLYAALAAESLEPAPPTDKATLLRRAHFDLTGLPPTPEQVRAFVQDERPAAFEERVDALLASPHFGERWARHWFDLVRYAETYGHEQDYPILHAWRYRDYVIRALNADLPYDQFVREHIAGDLLPEPRIHETEGYNESLVGTGFWYMHQATHAPVDVRQNQADHIENQIDVFSKAFLGMTVSCARCHDHKFDAVSARDYYALAGFLRSSRQQYAFLDPHDSIAQRIPELASVQDQVAAELPEHLQGLSEHALLTLPRYLDAARDLLSETAVTDPDALGLGPKLREAALAQSRDLDPGLLGRWVDALQTPLSPEQPFALWQQSLSEGIEDVAETPLLEDAGISYATFASGIPEGWTTTGHAFDAAPTQGITPRLNSHAPELIPPGILHSGRNSNKLQGVLRSPNFTLEHDYIHIRAAGRGTRIKLIVEGYQLRDFNGLLFDDTLIHLETGSQFAWHSMSRSIAKFKGRSMYLEFIDEGDGFLALEEVRFSNAPMPAESAGIARKLRGDAAPSPATPELLHEAYAHWTAGALKRCRGHEADALDLGLITWLLERELLPGAPGLPAHRETLARLEAALPAPVRALAILEGPPEDEHVFIRGNHKTPGELAPRRFLEALSGSEQPPITTGSGRLELAERLLAPDNPLPARVMVNRVWHYLFGRGIVPSVDNFGELGEAPTHPELLDHLATAFVENGWSIKTLIRQVMLSNAYQMSTRPASEMAEATDPANRLFHRMNLRRLEGEVIRDSILAVTGRLDATLFGPSVPIHLSDFMGMSRRPKVSGPLDGDRRRTIYVEVRRNFLSPMMLAFDMPLPDTTIGRRTVSNVPAQALTLMNDPFVVEQARAWGETIARWESAPAARIEMMWMQALGRMPAPEEVRQVLTFLDGQRAQYGLPEEALHHNPQLWADAAHILFMLKEFIFLA